MHANFEKLFHKLENVNLKPLNFMSEFQFQFLVFILGFQI